MENLEIIEKISGYCTEIVKNDSEMLKWRFGVTNEELPHIANIAKSIVLHKNDIMTGGGFVQSVCSDSLIESSQRADSTMQKVLSYVATFSYRAKEIKDKFNPLFSSNL